MRVSVCGRGGSVRMQHRRGKAGEQPRVKTDGGMRSGAKADGSALGGVRRAGAVTAPGGASSGMLAASRGTPAMCSDAPAASSDNTAATGKEAVLAVVLPDEVEEKGSEGRHFTGGKNLYKGERRDNLEERRRFQPVGMRRHRSVRTGKRRFSITYL